MCDITHNGLATTLDIHMRHRDGLLTTVSMLLQSFHLRGKRSGQLVYDPLMQF